MIPVWGIIRRCAGVGVLALSVAGSSVSVEAQSAHLSPPSGIAGYVWRDTGGEPLPFQDHEAIMGALRSATVISREKVGRGVAGVERLVLEHEGLRLHGAFRSVDVIARKSAPRGIERPRKKYRDAAIFESAAYELSQLLGIGRVPPVVERSIAGQEGTLQIWMEGVRPEVELVQGNLLRPPDIRGGCSRNRSCTSSTI